MEIEVCKRCVMDTTDPEIVFDENGICNHCTNAILNLSKPPYSLSKQEKQIALEKLIEEIKNNGKNKKYDCVVGISGGVDSSYVAYKVKELGLRPIAVHLDNGWDSELSVQNIENICKKLDIDLFTYVIDWEEFKDLQLSFLKASTPDSEIPTDHAIVAILYKIAAKYGIKYIMAGYNFSTESVMPKAWSYGHHDWKYIKSLQKIFGGKKLKSFPHISLLQMLYYNNIANIHRVPILNYLDYNKGEAVEIIKDKIGWRAYEYKHYESNYTKFYQAYVLPEKFNFDKRKAHFSSLIVSGQMTREKAIEELKKDIYPFEQKREDRNYVINKFGITEEEFDKIMNDKPKKYQDYPSYENSWYFKYAKKLYRLVKKITGKSYTR